MDRRRDATFTTGNRNVAPSLVPNAIPTLASRDFFYPEAGGITSFPYNQDPLQVKTRCLTCSTSRGIITM